MDGYNAQMEGEWSGRTEIVKPRDIVIYTYVRMHHGRCANVRQIHRTDVSNVV